MTDSVRCDLLAEPLAADQALSYGLFSSVVPDDELAPVAHALAARLAAGPTAAYAAIKRGLAFAATHGLADSLEMLADSLEMEARLQAELGRTQNHRAATQAFVRKEQPTYQGR